VVWLERYGIFATARHAEVQSALQDWSTFSSAAGVGLADFRKETPFRTPSPLLEADPPLHSRTRPVVATALSPAAMRELRPTFEAEARTLADDLARRGAFDGVADLAEVYPIKVFADALGLSEEGREHLLPYAAMIFNSFGPRNRLFEATMQGADAARDWVMAQCRREALRPGSLGARVFEAVDRQEVSDDEARLIVRSFLSAGLDTTAYALANTLYAFATHLEAWADLRRQPGLARGAFEEVMRFESSVQTFFRTTTCETELGGVSLPDGAKILLFLGAANRDPVLFPEPDRFDINRSPNPHLSFSAGRHFCLGAPLARLHGEVALSILFTRLPGLAARTPPDITASVPIRQVDNFLVTWQRR
jgi:cytochrome P450